MKVPQMMPWVGKDEYKAIEACFSDNWITEGPHAREFSKKLLNLIGVKSGVFAPNGTLALYLGLKAMGIGQGDEVIVPDFTFVASATAVEMTGATPVFVDVNNRNFQIDLQNADQLITKNTKAIMPVHMYGTVADIKQVVKFSKKYKLKIIEDAAETLGVQRDGKHARSFGDVGCFSFYADKTITTGEGGFVVTNNKKTYEKLLYLRNHGRLTNRTFIHPEIGYNFLITNMQAAMGMVQLAKLPEIVRRKQTIVEHYMKLLNQISEIIFFQPDKDAEWIPFRFPILVPDAERLTKYLKAHDIEARSFSYPLHKQPCFSHLRKIQSLKDQQFPNTMYAYTHGICLPTFPTLSKGQIRYVYNTIRNFYHETK